MKKKTALVAAIICALSLTLTACGSNKTSSEDSRSSVVSTAAESTESTESSEESSESSADSGSSESSSGASLWDSAKYTEDTELGEGAATVKIEVTAEEKTVTLTIKTDETNLEKILTANALVEGDESEYGLYIKKVNGIRADYNLDGAYWSLMKDGTPTSTGASGITAADGETYALVYTPS